MNPYNRFNLTRNPFGELHPSKRVDLACLDNNITEKLSDIFKKNDLVLQITGNHGRGKSTYLLSLHDHITKHLLEDIPYLQLNDAQPMIWRSTTAYFVDNVETLSLLNRLKLFRKYPKLVVCTPVDLTYQIRLAGRQVYTYEVVQTDLRLLQNIFDARVEDAVLNVNNAAAYPSNKLLYKLKEYCNTDIRAMESILYDIYYLLSRPNSESTSTDPSNKIKLTLNTAYHSPTLISTANSTFETAIKFVSKMDDNIIDWRNNNNN